MTRCISGKKRFRNDVDAQEALKKIRKRPREVIPVRFYPCDKCRGFHLTHSEGHPGKSRPIILEEQFKRYLNKE
ncbi:hypothetical protein CJD36_020005 [Flavipsychrobacter stenotrophus]|uniref:Uncharacterized protein n=1 Tax=Flavipsychrobacter stenotrophus TaxID=2077091 RepID=A0A2S7SRZ7_9BACT|nr:hypothetical protein [Flavipsychrobacter stenotrophus]PQJ09524.1 hypothetical protein CJD36_020005 [Flavipsychrobacter stenotrophus]